MWAVAETVCSALILFLSYRIVVHRLGLGSLGIWSLVVATTSFVRVVDPGTSAGLSRFVAVANARSRPSEIGNFFIAALISTFVFYAILSTLAYWPLRYALRLALSGPEFLVAQDLLPYGITSFVLLNCYIAAAAALVGLQRADLRSKIVISCLFIQLVFVLLLTPINGLEGFAQAQILQYVFGIFVSYLVSVHQMRGHFALWPLFKLKKTAFVELWLFGIRLQSISVISFLYEPVSKFVISSVGGAETLGLYEMALKYVVQVRQLALGPTTILMPAFAHVNVRAPNELTALYRRSLAAAVIVGSALMAAASISSPILSVLLFNYVDRLFVIFVAILSAASFVTIVSSPASNLAVSKGLLKGNFWGTVVASCGAPLLAFTFGKFFGSVGAVSSAVFALGVGNFLSMTINAYSTGMRHWPQTSDIAAFMKRDLIRLIPFAATAGKCPMTKKVAIKSERERGTKWV
jgi:O-antigen/teichoic acid export membrane protein